MVNHNHRWLAALIGLLILFAAAWLLVPRIFITENIVSTGPAPTDTHEPIVPTRTRRIESRGHPSRRETAMPSRISEPAPAETTPAMANITPTTPSIPETAAGATAVPASYSLVNSELARFGVTAAESKDHIDAAYFAGLKFGSGLDWNVEETPPVAPIDFWQMVRVGQQGIRETTWDELSRAIAANPGSFWLIGNEPDVQWQDNVTPQRYAEIYHEVYHYIKERDSDAMVVIGGVSQPTPLRLAYLDIVLETYESTFGSIMPVDIWNVHAFTLREEAGSWGVGIPPGMDGATGILYEIEDHDNLDILAQNLVDFRKWMAERGYGQKPLVISEYGILMPEDYGFSPQRVATFLESSFDFFRQATGEDGYPLDDDRLVQWWFWYSVYDKGVYTTGNLWDIDDGQLTELGQVWSQYVTENGIAP